MKLSISLPLEDLVVASPAFETLENSPAGTDLSATEIARLEDYFTHHLELRNATTTYPLTAVTATLHSAQNEHVGQYTELALSWASHDAITADTFPLTLTYDAIMHEVRNHRATVFWKSPDRQPSVLTNFGFKATDGKPQAVLLIPPQN